MSHKKKTRKAKTVPKRAGGGPISKTEARAIYRRLVPLLECPDCNSDVTVTVFAQERAVLPIVKHDDTCPTLAAMEREAK